MSRILYISAANYDQKHLENSKIGLENSWTYLLPKEWEPCNEVTFNEQLEGSILYCWFFPHDAV